MIQRLSARAPLLSIVIPTLNEEAQIGSLLHAVDALCLANEEILVVDGGSRDETITRARETGLARVRLIESPRGRGAQMNAGARVARGAWLWFLHADSQLNPAILDGLWRQISEGQAEWGFFRLRIADRGWLYRWIEFGLNQRSRAYSTPSGDQGIFVRRELFEAVGGFDADAPLMEDLLLVDRLRRRAAPGPPAGWLGTSARRWQRDGVLRTVFRMWALRAAFRLGVSPRRLARHYRVAR